MAKEVKEVETIPPVPITHKSLTQALLAAQAEFTPVLKENTADTGKFKYNYADLNSVLQMAVPVLNKHGIVFTQPVKIVDCKLRQTTVLIWCREDGETDRLESIGFEIPPNLGPQDIGKYSTYFRRYDACSLLGIAPDDDVDANDDAKITRRAKPEAKPEPKKEFKRAEPNTSYKDEIRSAEEYSNTQDENFVANNKDITDNDIPDVISSKPTEAEYKDYCKRLKVYVTKTSVDKVGNFIRATLDKKEFKTPDLTKAEWDRMLNLLDNSEKEGKLTEVVK